MQNLIAKLRQQTSIISKKPGFLSGKFLQITQDLNKMQKIPHSLLWALVSRKRVQSFNKKYLTVG